MGRAAGPGRSRPAGLRSSLLGKQAVASARAVCVAVRMVSPACGDYMLYQNSGQNRDIIPILPELGRMAVFA